MIYGLIAVAIFLVFTPGLWILFSTFFSNDPALTRRMGHGENSDVAPGEAGYSETGEPQPDEHGGSTSSAAVEADNWATVEARRTAAGGSSSDEGGEAAKDPDEAESAPFTSKEDYPGQYLSTYEGKQPWQQ